MKTSPKPFLLLVLALALVSSSALAEEATKPAPVPPAAPYVPYVSSGIELQLVSREPLAITVYYAASDERPLFSCQTPCRVRVYPAKYRFHVRGGADKIEADTVAEVTSSQRLRFSLPTRGDKSGALATAITGTVLIPTGLVVATVSALANACFDGCSPDHGHDGAASAGVFVGLGMLVAGAIMTPVGWSSFAHNRKPQYETDAIDVASNHSRRARARRTTASSPTHIGFAVAPTPGGGSAAVWGSF